MRLFNKTIDRQLFKQYALGSDLSKQEVVAKIFNPMGAGNWFILNSDPQDPDYLWAIVDLGYGAEVGSVSRTDLETYRGRFGMGFERDLSFEPINAEELYNGLRQGKYYADGGGVENKPYIFFFYDENGNEQIFKTLAEATKEAKQQGQQKVRDNLGEEYFVQYADGGSVERNITGLNSLGEKVKDVKGLFYWKSNEDGKIRITSGNGSVYFLEFDTLPEAEAYVEKVNAKTPNFFSSTYAKGGGVNVGYNVFNYTDNIYATDEVFKTKALANKFIKEFRSRFSNQGYYRDNRMNKINIQDIDLLAIPSDFNPFKKFADGGDIADFTDNQQMIMNQNVELEHHHEELEDILEDEMPVPAWVVAKMATATQSISDVTHYLDGQKELMEDENEDVEVRSSEFFPVDEENEEEDDDQEAIENQNVVEPIDVTAGTKTELTKNFTDDALGNLRGFLKGMEGIDLRDDYTFDYRDEQFEVEPIINSDENGVSNAVFTFFDGDGEEVGEVAYSREGGKQKFTANSDYFEWRNAKFEDGGYFDGTIPSVSSYMSTYAKGGEVAKAEIIGLKKNILGTTDVEMKITGMRKPQRFSVYPIGKDDTDKIITIQSETRIGKIDLSSGRGLMSQSHSNGAYFVHFQMDKLTPFTINEKDLKDITSHIFRTAGDKVGSRGIFSDNSGASGVYAKGGEVAKADRWYDRLRNYEREHFSKKFPMSKDETLDEWTIRVWKESGKSIGVKRGQYANGGGIDMKELWYVTDKDDKVKNISTTLEQAQVFLSKIGYVGNVNYVKVPIDDWNSEKITISSIKNYAQKFWKSYANGGYFDGTIPKVSSYMSTYAKGGKIDNKDLEKLNAYWQSFYKGVMAGKKDEGYITITNKDELNKYITSKLGNVVKNIELIEKGKNYPYNDSYPYYEDIYSVELKNGTTFKIVRSYGRPRWQGNVDYKEQIIVENIKQYADGGNVEKPLTRFRVGESFRYKNNGSIIYTVTKVYNDGACEARDEEGDNYSFEFDELNELVKAENNYAKGGGIGFIPMDLEENLALLAKWGGTDIKGVIGILNAMIDSGLTNEDLIPKPTKNTRFQIERATEKKIQEIWDKIKPNYKGDFKGNMYYSTLKEMISRNWIYKDVLVKFKPYRKYQKDSFADGGQVRTYNDIFGKVIIFKEEEVGNFTIGIRSGFNNNRHVYIYEGGLGEYNDKGLPRNFTQSPQLSVEFANNFYSNLKRKVEYNQNLTPFQLMKDVKFLFADGGFMDNVYANGGGLGKKYYVIDDKDAKILSKAFDTEEEAKVEKYKIFEKTNNFFLTLKGVEDVRMKYAKKDIATLIKDGNMSMYDTKYGVIHLNYNNGEITIKNNKYDYQKEDYETIFKGGKDAGLFFIAEAYEVEEMAKGGSVKKDWWNTVVNPNEDFNNFDDKMPIDWDVDDFKSWVVSNSDLDGNLDKEVLDIVKMPQSKLLVEYLNKNGSGKNNNEYYKKYGNWQSALYDIFTQMKKDYLFKKSLKYILKADIKTVTVKTKNGKEVTYSGADVLNGNYVLAKGGDIISKATYFGKNNVVEVELNDGSKVKPVNGYWIKKGAEPINGQTTPTLSTSSEPKIGTTQIRKDMRGNWRAETNIDNFNGYDWRLSTVKTYSGNLVSSAQGGKSEPSGTKGYSLFKYTVFEDPNHTLEVSKPKRLTDKVVTEQHDKALAKFKKFMETGMFKGGGKISNFDKLSSKVAEQYEGKPVKSQYQEEYGKYYSKVEAKEVGDKVAGKVKAMQSDEKAFGGFFGGAMKEKIIKKKYDDIEGKIVISKDGQYYKVIQQVDDKLLVINPNLLGTGVKPFNLNISEIEVSSYK